MAGLGEATAIIGVAQLGFSLAKTLNVFIGDYKDARQTLTRMGAEIESTSLAMERLGNLAQKGRLYGNRGVLEAAGLANRYSDAIAEIRAMLKKKNKTINQNAVNPDEIELSSFQRIQFAFLKPKLEISQLEVSRIKADLTLTYLSMIALTGDTDAEKKQARAEIPAWTRTLKWANHEYDKAVSRQKNSAVHSFPGLPLDPPPYANSQGTVGRRTPGRQSSLIQDDVNAEHLKQYIQWAEKEQAEAQQKAEELRLELLRREQEKRLAEETAREQQIAAKAIKEYEERRAKEAAELAFREQEKEEELRQRLQDARVTEEEIDRILSKAPLMLTGPERYTNAHTSFSNPAPTGQTNPPSANSPVSNHSRPQQQHDARVPNHRVDGAHSMPPKATKLKPPPKRTLPRPLLEAWCIDQASQMRFCTPLNEDWLDDFIAGKAYKRSSRRMWERYAQLHVWYRKQINEIFEEKMRDRKHKWSMISLDQTRATKSIFSFRRSGNDSLVQLILVQLPHQVGQTHNRLWLDDGDDLPPLLPTAPQLNPPGPNGEGSEASFDGDTLSETENETTGMAASNSRPNRNDPSAPWQSPSQRPPDVIIEVFEMGDGNSTTLPIDKTDGTRLQEQGYQYIETATDYVIISSSRLTEMELDSLLNRRYPVVGIVTYCQDFLDLNTKERAKARDYIKRNLTAFFPSHDGSRFRAVTVTKPADDGLPLTTFDHPIPGGSLVVQTAQSATATHDPQAGHVRSRHGDIPGPDTRSSLSKKTRFAEGDDFVHYASPPPPQDWDETSSDELIMPDPRALSYYDRSLRVSSPSSRRRSPATSYRYPRRDSGLDDDSDFGYHNASRSRTSGYTPRLLGGSSLARNEYRHAPVERYYTSDDDVDYHGISARSSIPPAPVMPSHIRRELSEKRSKPLSPRRRSREIDIRRPYPAEEYIYTERSGRERSPYALDRYRDTAPYSRDRNRDTFLDRGSRSREYETERARDREEIAFRVEKDLREDMVRYEDIRSRPETTAEIRRRELDDINIDIRRRERSRSIELEADEELERRRDRRELTRQDARLSRRMAPPPRASPHIHIYNSHPSRGGTMDSYVPGRGSGSDGSDAEATYGSTSRYMAERLPDPELHNDKDIADMQLAKYTGGINLIPEPTRTTSTDEPTPAAHPRPRRSRQRSLATETVGRPTVEDTIDESNLPIEDRITEIHDEPESLLVTEETTHFGQSTSEPAKQSEEAWSWGFGRAKAAGTKSDAQALDRGDVVPTTKEDIDDDWSTGFTVGKKKKKGKKRREAEATDDGVTHAWSPNPPLEEEDQNAQTSGGNENGNGDSRGKRDGDDDDRRWSWNSNSNQKDWDAWEKRTKGGSP